MIIKILHQYHNNMFDTVRALEKMADVEFLSYRISKLVPGIRNRQPAILGRGLRCYLPWQLWQLIPRTTDILILKHVNDPINLIPYLIAWLKKIHCVVVVQRPTHRNFPGYQLLFRLLMAWLNWQNVAIMAQTKEGWRDMKLYGKRTRYIPACVNPGRFARSTRVRPPGQLHLLAVAKYQERKNLTRLIEALAQLRQRHQRLDLRLTIVGTLAPKPGPKALLAALQDQLERWRLEPCVRLVTNVPYEEMPSWYARADVFIFPAEHEPLGYAVVEAMAAGMPILCSQDVGAASYVEEGHNGWLLAPDSTKAIVEGCERFIRESGEVDGGILARFGQRSRKIIVQKHAPEVFLKHFQMLI